MTPAPSGDVALAGCRRSPDAAADDLWPDPDGPALVAAWAARGCTATAVAWDDPGVDWASFAHVLVSSTWDSPDRPGEHAAWAAAAGAVTELHNDAATLAWGLDKSHQVDLAAAGVPVIPTAFVGPDDRWSPPASGEYVVKPSVSGGGRGTARYGPSPADAARAAAHVAGLQRRGHRVMVQPYVASLDALGEVDVTMIGGCISHAVGKRPLLSAGDDPGDRPWERMGWAGLVEVPPAGRTVAERTFQVVAELLDRAPTYCRVDLVTLDDAPTVIEVEVVDPYLSLDLHPGGADLLVEAILGG